MTMLRYDPWQLMNAVSRDLAQLQHRLAPAASQDSTQYSTVDTSAWVPAVDIKEEPEAFLLQVDLPGVESKDIDIAMDNNILTIKGERYSEAVEQNQAPNYKRVERVYGSFYRRFTLPDTADADNISAQCKNGVLAVRIPKKPLAQAKKIAVQGE